MEVILSNSSGKPIYEQIMLQIKGQILSGKLKKGDALPSIRVLARELRISVITTKRAYDELEREGLLCSVAGKGTFVAADNLPRLQEERLKEIEAMLRQAVGLAKEYGISLEEIQQILTLFDQEEQ